jgi:hypothetical protein
MSQGLFERIAENPFYVLGVSTTATRTEIEREGSKLLSMLELGLKEAKVYRSPRGAHERTAELVRAAMAELREPKRRLVHEVLASLPVSVTVPAHAPGQAPVVAWERAPRVYGLGPAREKKP